MNWASLGIGYVVLGKRGDGVVPPPPWKHTLVLMRASIGSACPPFQAAVVHIVGMHRRIKFLGLVRAGALPAVVVVVLAIAWRLGYFELDRRQQLFETVQRLRLWRGIGLVYLFGYAIAVSVGLPSVIMTIIAGAIFGPRTGAFLAWSSCLLGTIFAHELARRIARKPIQRLFGRHQLLDRLKERGDVRTLARLRVIPAGPFAVLPYVAAVAGVSVKRLLLATALATLPGVIAYAYVGSALMRAVVSPAEASGALWVAGAISVVMPLVALVAKARA
jgi:uncharacterized membrane protein YdjX (TVP38/TMEM64 family)